MQLHNLVLEWYCLSDRPTTESRLRDPVCFITLITKSCPDYLLNRKSASIVKFDSMWLFECSMFLLLYRDKVFDVLEWNKTSTGRYLIFMICVVIRIIIGSMFFVECILLVLIP